MAISYIRGSKVINLPLVICLVLAIPLVQVVTIHEAQASTAMAWQYARTLLSVVAPVGIPGGVLLRIVLAAGGTTYLLFKSGAVDAIRNWYLANWNYRSDGPDTWDGNNGSSYSCYPNPGGPYWDDIDKHWHMDGWVTKDTDQHWRSITTFTASTESLAWIGFNQRAYNLIKADAPNATSAYEGENPLTTPKDIGDYQGTGPTLPTSGQIYMQPGAAIPANYNIMQTNAQPVVEWEGMTAEQENDAINRYDMTSVNGETGAQQASSLDNQTIADQQNYVQNERIATALDDIKANTDPKATGQSISQTSKTFGERWNELQGFLINKFPFNMWSTLDGQTYTGSGNETGSFGTWTMGANGPTVDINPLTAMGGTIQWFRQVEGYFMYAVFCLYLYRRITTL